VRPHYCSGKPWKWKTQSLHLAAHRPRHIYVKGFFFSIYDMSAATVRTVRKEVNGWIGWMGMGCMDAIPLLYVTPQRPASTPSHTKRFTVRGGLTDR
jgi:hypothetical protein